ncbi:MAG: S-layer homology domain-containing protein [Clostridiales bacterium]|nr:S-layer homology domain-containing protein [Clostridiales bacterium]
MSMHKGFLSFILVVALVLGNCSSAMAKKYEINGQEVSWEEFKAFCEAFGLDPYSTGGSGSEGPGSDINEAEDLIRVIDEILEKTITAGMTESEKTKAVYDFLTYQFVHMGEEPLPGSPKITFESVPVNSSYDIVIYFASRLLANGEGNSDYFSALFATMLSRLGIEAEIWGGQYGSDGQTQLHAWNRAYVDGAWHWYDADVEGSIYRQEGTILYSMYEKGDEEWSKNYSDMKRSHAAEQIASIVPKQDSLSLASVTPTVTISPTMSPTPTPTPTLTLSPTPTVTSAPVSDKVQSLGSPGAPSEWAFETIARAAEIGLVPEALLKNYQSPVARGDTAQMFINIVEKVSGMDIDAYLNYKGLTISNSFSDTSDKAVLAANALGIINGVGDGKFNPNGTLTRAQAAIIINRVAIALDTNTVGFSHSFTDVAGHWVDPELGWPVMAGIINGIGNNRFYPEGKLTTEQSICIAMLAYEYLSTH